jgi:hypothetical protein
LMNDSRLAAVEACWPMSVLRTERQAAPRMHAHEGVNRAPSLRGRC